MASFRSIHAQGMLLALAVFVASPAVAATKRSLVENSDGYNEALLVGVGHGLPGIDLDVDTVEAIATNPAYKFNTSYLEEAEGTSANVAAKLASLSEKTGSTGTLFYYFSGHGGPGSLYMQDGTMKIKTMRDAMEKGRAALGPMERVVMMFDSCYSGSLLDPVRMLLPLSQMYDSRISSAIFADEVVRQMSPARGEASTYWKKLFVFASSRADETSLAGQGGSVFTVALKKAFDEVSETNGTMETWVKKTQEYTVGHHPVARFVPETLAYETMKP